MKYAIIGVLTILSCIVSVSVVAQDQCDITLQAIVVEAHTSAPLQPMLVFVEELNKTYETNSNGKFRIDSLCAGKYTLHFHALGFEHKVVEVKLTESTTLKFKVAHTDGQLDKVTVVGLKNDDGLLQVSDRLSATDIAENSGKSLGGLLQQVNGVSILSNGATIAKPVIHGLHSNRIVLLNNGIRQEDQQWGGEHAPNVDPFLAKNITVIKGAASVRYGADAIGGVVLVEPNLLPVEKGIWNGEVNLAAFSNNRMGVASGMLEHNIAKVDGLSFRLQGTYKKGGNYRIPGYWIANSGLEEQNYSAAVGYKKAHYGAEIFYSRFDTDLGIYRGAFTGNQNDLDAAIASDTPLVSTEFSYDLNRPMQHVEHDMVKAKGYLDSRVGRWDVIYGYQHNFRQEYDVLRKENGKAQLNLTLNTQTLNLNLEHNAIGSIKGNVGVDAIYQENFIQPGDRVFIPNYRSRGIAGYVIERKQGDGWLAEAGLRYDYRWYELFNPEGNNQQVVRYELDYSNLSGTLGLTKHLSEHWHTTATLGNAFRAPQANELFSSGLHHGAARIEQGDKSLKPERAYNANIEVKYKNEDNHMQATVSLYSQYINNFIYLEPGGELLTIRGSFQVFNYKQTNAMLNGVDASLQHVLRIGDGFLTTHAKASFLFARNTSAGDWLILMPSDRLQLSTRYSRDLKGSFKSVYIGASGKYVFNQWRIPENFDEIDHPRPPAAYFLLDGTVGSKVVFGKQALNLSLSVTNILNTSYRDYLDAFRYFIDQPGTNVVLRVNMPLTFNNNKQ